METKTVFFAVAVTVRDESEAESTANSLVDKILTDALYQAYERMPDRAPDSKGRQAAFGVTRSTTRPAELNDLALAEERCLIIDLDEKSEIPR
jgi:hypothetical protein